MGRLRGLLAEPARPSFIRRRNDAHWLAVGTVCVGAFMGQLDASIVTIAYPTLQTHFGRSLGAVEWVGLSYLFVLVATVIAVGRFADMVGRKLLYVYGFGLFTIASLLCGFAPTLWALVAFRVLQALGAAMLQANSVALITTVMPPGQLGRGIGVQGAAQAVGLAIGPSVGGVLIALGGWRLVFFVNVPVGILGMVLGWFLLPRTRDLATRVRFDWAGLAAFAASACLLLVALSFGQLWLLLAAAAGGVTFWWRESHTPDPMVDLRLFRRVRLSAGLGSGLLSYLVLFGVLFAVPFYLERGLGSSTTEAGAVLTALPVALGLTAPLAGRLADRWGPRPLTVGGMVIVTVALAAAAMWHGSSALLVGELAAVGVGIGAFTPANNAAIMGTAPPHAAGVTGGLLNMTRGLGTALGVAVTGLAFAAAAGTSHPHGLPAAADGFTAACALLAALAALSALVATPRSRRPPFGTGVPAPASGS